MKPDTVVGVGLFYFSQYFAVKAPHSLFSHLCQRPSSILHTYIRHTMQLVVLYTYVFVCFCVCAYSCLSLSLSLYIYIYMNF
jgi:hypothetical protein